jgi:ubiquinone/menaquinone biosynthesis C-methylase UbiE
VLGVGTGTGALASTVEGSLPASQVVGIDPSAGFIDYARRGARSQRAQFEVGDAQALRFADASFDHTMSLLVMTFIPDHDGTFVLQVRASCVRGQVPNGG